MSGYEECRSVRQCQQLVEEVLALRGKVAGVRAVIFLACHHCGRLPETDGDHTCPCPTSDSECLLHTSDPVAPLEPLRAALGDDR